MFSQNSLKIKSKGQEKELTSGSHVEISKIGESVQSVLIDQLKISPYLTSINSYNQVFISLTNYQMYSSQLSSNFFSYGLDQQIQLLISSIQNSEVLDVRTILNYFKANQSISLIPLRDKNQQNLLHIAAFNNQPKIIDLLFQYEKQISNRKQIKNWIDEPNQELYGALHFAAYRGSTRIFELFREEGADLNLFNAQGQNSFSIAVSADQILAMVWLKMRGVQFLAPDIKGRTSLHWASFNGNEVSIALLLSWIMDDGTINQQDGEGMTALHLAALQGSIRIVKKLLLRGADHNLKDTYGLTPAQIAEQNQFQNIVDILKSKNCLLQFFNIQSSQFKEG